MKHNYDSPLDAAKVRTLTEANIALIQHRAKLVAVIATVMQAKLDGKQVTKRFATAVEAALPGYMVHLKEDRQYLYVWGNGLDYNSRLSVFLGYDSELSPFSFALWQDKHNCGEVNQNYLNAAIKALANVDQKVAAYNAALDALQWAQEDMDGLSTD